MNMTTLALASVILAVEFALLAWIVVFVALRRKRGSKVESGSGVSSSVLSERLNTLEQQNTSLSAQLVSIQDVVKQLQTDVKRAASRSPLPNTPPPPPDRDFKHDETEELIDLFEDSPLHGPNASTRAR